MNERILEKIVEALEENAKATRELAEQLKRFSALDKNVLKVRVVKD